MGPARTPEEFIARIMDLRTTFLFSVTSYLRTPLHNQNVCGAENSKHLYGLAVDVVLDDPSDGRSFMAYASVLGLYPVLEHGWIHVQGIPKGTEPGSVFFPLIRQGVPMFESDGRPLGWELTEEAKRARADEQAV